MPVGIELGFTVDSNEPLDHRMVVENEEARLAIPWYHRYEGLLVWEKATDTLFVCKDPNANDEGENGPADWQAITTFDPSVISGFPFSGSAEITGSLLVTGPSTVVAPTSSNTSHLFLVRTTDSDESKFVVNLEGVTVLGKFEATPTVVEGGMFYSASGEFYLGC
jgi:hypothetical protein